MDCPRSDDQFVLVEIELFSTCDIMAVKNYSVRKRCKRNFHGHG